MGRAVVLGAGPLGTAVARRLEAGGSSVQLVSVLGNPAYDMPGTEPPGVDGRDVEQLTELCESVQVVYLCLNAHYVDWHETYPPVVAAAVEASARAGARLVYADNVYLYGPVDRPLTEDLPAAATTRKGMLCAGLASDVLAAHERGRIETIIGRAADMYGPGALNSSFGTTFGQRHFPPALQGKPMYVLGDIDAPHTYIYVEDFARGLVTLGAEDDAQGRVWHVPAAPTLSHRELATIVYEEAGFEPRARSSRIANASMKLMGRFQADVGEVTELMYLFERPHIVDHSAFEARFGADPTPHREAVAATLDWFRANTT